MKSLIFAILMFTFSATGGESWRFVSIPDFLNVDTDYPQKGWEDSLSYILKAVKAESPDFVVVAGDLVMGHWGNEETIRKYAKRYYPAWTKRLEAHGLKFFAAIGDHEIGDNPWPKQKSSVVPVYKEMFRQYLKMPLNGPDHMKGTAFWWKHKGTLFISVDVFEKDPKRGIVAKVTGKQLEWVEAVLSQNKDAKHVIVMGHTPILWPVTTWSSSALKLTGSHASPLWQVFKKHNVDIYLCGEVHAITCIGRDNVMQVAHGGLIGYNTRTNYMVGTVYDDRIELEIKEIDLVPSGPKLWQPGNNRPLEKVTITDAIKKRGFVTVGRVTISREADKKFLNRLGYFAPETAPKKRMHYRPFDPESAPPRMKTLQ